MRGLMRERRRLLPDRRERERETPRKPVMSEQPTHALMPKSCFSLLCVAWLQCFF